MTTQRMPLAAVSPVRGATRPAVLRPWVPWLARLVRCTACWGLLAPAAALCASAQIDGLLQRLARPAPSSTPFVEAHFSQLLAHPLVVSGKLEYLGKDALARSVEAPYHERSEIRGDTVSLQRESQPARTFSLQRAPELRSLRASFAALLAGDRATLEEQFTLDLHGDDANWTLGLTPRDPHVLEHIRSVLVFGSNSEPHCLVTFEANDNTTILLLGSAARASLPSMPDRAWFDEQCHKPQK